MQAPGLARYNRWRNAALAPRRARPDARCPGGQRRLTVRHSARKDQEEVVELGMENELQVVCHHAFLSVDEPTGRWG